MPIRLHRAILPTILLTSFACGSSGGIEGKYYNAAGQFVLELNDGKVTMAPGMQFMNAVYEVRGDSIVLRDPAGTDQLAVLMRKADGSIDAGMMGELKKK